MGGWAVSYTMEEFSQLDLKDLSGAPQRDGDEELHEAYWAALSEAIEAYPVGCPGAPRSRVLRGR